jgi:hypothetical protein
VDITISAKNDCLPEAVAQLLSAGEDLPFSHGDREWRAIKDQRRMQVV